MKILRFAQNDIVVKKQLFRGGKKNGYNGKDHKGYHDRRSSFD